jgi:hypothetical protein
MDGLDEEKGYCDTRPPGMWVVGHPIAKVMEVERRKMLREWAKKSE